MAKTYDISDLGTNVIHRTRLAITDTRDRQMILHNEEIQYYLDQGYSGVNLHLRLIDIMIGRLAHEQDVSGGHVNSQRAKRVESLRKTADLISRSLGNEVDTELIEFEDGPPSERWQ